MATDTAPASAPTRAAPAGWLPHLLRGLAVLLAGTALAAPAVWWTASQESHRAAAVLNGVVAEDLALTSARVDAGELPARVLESPGWEPVTVTPLPPFTVLTEALALGAAALAGFLLAHRTRHGRTTALLTAAGLLAGSFVVRDAAFGVTAGLVRTVPPWSWDLDPVLMWHDSPFTFVPGTVMAVLAAAGALAARPDPSPCAPHRVAGLVCGSVSAAGLAAVVALDLVAVEAWTWTPGIAFFVVLVGTGAWLGSGAPATPVLAAVAMLAASAPYLRDGLDGMTLVHLGIALAAVTAVAAAGLRAPAARALTRLVA